MFNKFAFLSVDPWEPFLSPVMQSHSRKYYEFIKLMMKQKKIEILCWEYMDLYGEAEPYVPSGIFEKNKEIFQLVYIQSSRKKLLGKVFQEADVVMVGFPGNKKHFEKIYMTLLPWKDRILFLWNDQSRLERSYLDSVVRECMIEKRQIISITESCQRIFGIKKAPDLFQELMSRY